MPEQTETKPDAEQPDATPDASKADDARRAKLAALTKAELVDHVLSARDASDRATARLLELHDEQRQARRARPEDAFVVSALLDLHRTVEERQGATLRGRSPAIGNRYLEAARTLGDELVVAILGPNAKV